MEEKSLVMVQNDQVVVSSRDIAEHFKKRHDHVVRDIRSLLEGLPKNGDTHMFFEHNYIYEQNGQYIEAGTYRYRRSCERYSC